ncbi:MAG: hypothetical protein ACI4TU_04720 [Candidatus Cryptobacteroides sp.]
MNNYKEILKEKGIIELDLKLFPDMDLIEIASIFGKVVPGARDEIVQSLPARDKGEGPIGSFSYAVGYGSFPWHTDTAYWDIPARYLLLTSQAASSCATLVQSFASIRDGVCDFDYLISRSVFFLDVPGRKRYISPVVVGDNGEKGLRLDFHIYRPVNKESYILQERVGVFLKENFERKIWTGENVIIFDNWKYIHSRENAYNDKTRVLKRIYINELD